jgi:hypothetical protein
MKTGNRKVLEIVPKPDKAELVRREQAALKARREDLARMLTTRKLDLSERAFLGTCQMLYRSNRGCDTPFENFFGSLVWELQFGKWPTPRIVEKELIEFRQQWNDMRVVAAEFVERYRAASSDEGVGDPPSDPTAGEDETA